MLQWLPLHCCHSYCCRLLLLLLLWLLHSANPLLSAPQARAERRQLLV
jgi:hypothetical protein